MGKLLWSTTTIVTAIALAYYHYVPPAKKDLGSLRDAPPNAMRGDIWEEHGYVDLPNGKTHYYLIGPEDGKKVLGCLKEGRVRAWNFNTTASTGPHAYCSR